MCGADAGGHKVQAGLGVDLRVGAQVGHVRGVVPAHALDQHPLPLPAGHHLLHVLRQDQPVPLGVQKELRAAGRVPAHRVVQPEALAGAQVQGQHLQEDAGEEEVEQEAEAQQVAEGATQLQGAHEGLDGVQDAPLARGAVEDDPAHREALALLRVRGVEQGAELAVDHAAPVAEDVEDEGVAGHVVLGQHLQQPLGHLGHLVGLEEQRLCRHDHPDRDVPARTRCY